jgi:hypothetical protein
MTSPNKHAWLARRDGQHHPAEGYFSARRGAHDDPAARHSHDDPAACHSHDDPAPAAPAAGARPAVPQLQPRPGHDRRGRSFDPVRWRISGLLDLQPDEPLARRLSPGERRSVSCSWRSHGLGPEHRHLARLPAERHSAAERMAGDERALLTGISQHN